jgi:hypothetical protein
MQEREREHARKREIKSWREKIQELERENASVRERTCQS